MRCIAIVLISLFTFLPGVAQNSKGLYVDQFASILGNTAAEDSLLLYAQTNSFNYLALYQLHLVHAQIDLTDFSGSAPMAAFISKAKTQYGITNVGAIGESYWFFENRIHIYNQNHPNADEQFDVFNLEFEFWQTTATGPSGYYCTSYLQPEGYTCDTAGAFDFFINDLRRIDSLAATEGHISETYVGWPTEGQCHAITATCDRVLVHAYVSNVNNLYGYTQTRLSYFGTSADTANLIIIFSSEPSFMGPWLMSNPEYTAWNLYSNDYANETAPWTSGIHMLGYQWFAYTDMPYDLSMHTNAIAAAPYCIVQDENDLVISASDLSARTFTLYNAAGEPVSEQHSTSSFTRIAMNALPTGFYILRVTDNSSGEVYTHKILFTHR